LVITFGHGCRKEWWLLHTPSWIGTVLWWWCNCDNLIVVDPRLGSAAAAAIAQAVAQTGSREEAADNLVALPVSGTGVFT